MDRATSVRVAKAFPPFGVVDRFGFPVDPSHITFVGGKRLDARLTELRRRMSTCARRCSAR